MKKALCPKCQKLIVIDETMPTFVCEECKEQGLTESAIKNYYHTISLYSRKGETAIKGSTEYKEGYDYYSKLLAIKDDDLNVLMWTVLSRIYCSNLHEIYIKEATDILLKGSEKVEINNKNILSLSDALNKIRLDINIIIEALRYRSKESLYALNNYHKAIDEYIYFLKTYITIYEALGELNKLLKDNKEILNNEIKRLNDLAKEKIEVKNNSDKKHNFYTDKGKVTIDIYPNKKKLYKTRVILYAVTFIGAILSLIGVILLSTNVNSVAKIVLLCIGLPMFIGGYFIGHKLKSINLNLNY